jgi:nucleotide-binding universal stress UspA family protein
MIPRKILVAYDGSEPSEKTFRYALETAKRFQATLQVLSVAQVPEPAVMEETEAFLESAGEHFEEKFKALRKLAEAAGVPLATEVAAGHPAEQIIRKAVKEKVDLIVVGHRGRSRVGEWLLGSVAKRVASYAPCAVTIVR